jgi:hypothetical protein
MPFVKAKGQPLKFMPKADLEKAQKAAATKQTPEIKITIPKGAD